MMAAADFLAENNQCGQTILRLVSRANAIIAELLRLKDFIPHTFHLEQSKYSEILVDFRYFKDQDGFDNRINNSEILQDLDEELRKNYLEILTRFYLVFESVHKYVTDLNDFLNDLEEGIYIQQSLETVFLNDEGKQLMCEALYLYGIMLLVIDHHMEGPSRERMLVCYYRHAPQRTDSNSKLDEVCQLLRSTGFLKSQPGRRPPNYPEEYFKRLPIRANYLEMVIGHLRSDDIYHQITFLPHPEHRSNALAQQAAMLIVSLYFTPDILHNQTAKMREIVDKFFPDNWVTSIYMGLIVNLMEIWEPYKAARLALSNTILGNNVKDCSTKHGKQMDNLINQLRLLLKEGALHEEFLLDNMQKNMNLIRECNVTLRWMLLHTNALTPGAELMKKCRQIRDQVLNDTKYKPLAVFELLLDTAELELTVRDMFRHMLAEKRTNWQKCRNECIERLQELADVYSGTKPLTRVDKNESLQLWFREIAQQVDALNYEDSTASGRKITQLIQALQEVQEFHQLETQLQVQQFLSETRRLLLHMMRTANIREDVLITLQMISDLSYAWLIIDSYTCHMQTAVKKDPSLVGRLRATFLKLSSALDLPLMRINQAHSADLVSVSQYYSAELVSYVRHVLHVIPSTMFTLVESIVHLQTNVIKEIPLRLDKDKLRDYAQLDHRFEVTRLTESVSTFTEGILAMKTTLVGIVRLDPKRLLEEGIRRELVVRMANAMHTTLIFNPKAKTSELASKLASLGESLEGLRKSFEYIQDYVRIQGLRMFQEETARIVGYNVEQECNAFQKGNYVLDWQSRFQSTAVPIPKPTAVDPRSATFIGRLACEILRITDPKSTVYVAATNTWYDDKSQAEVLNLLLFAQLERALSTSGLAGLDTLFAFMIADELSSLISELQRDVFRHQDSLETLAAFDHWTTPTCRLLTQPAKSYNPYAHRFQKLYPVILERLLKVGQLQLLRHSCAFQLRSTASFDSGLLYSALETLSLTVVNDVIHADNPADWSSSLIPELAQYLQWSGLYQPLQKVYISTRDTDTPYAAHLLFLFIISHLNKLTYSKQIGGLVARRLHDNMDGMPFVVGLATLLRHLGHGTIQTCCCLLIQFVRSQLEAGASQKNGLMELPVDCGIVLAVIEQWVDSGLVTQTFAHSLLNPGVWSLYKMSMP